MSLSELGQQLIDIADRMAADRQQRAKIIDRIINRRGTSPYVTRVWVEPHVVRRHKRRGHVKYYVKRS